jgi:hypothetical protein
VSSYHFLIFIGMLLHQTPTTTPDELGLITGARKSTIPLTGEIEALPGAGQHVPHRGLVPTSYGRVMRGGQGDAVPAIPGSGANGPKLCWFSTGAHWFSDASNTNWLVHPWLAMRSTLPMSWPPRAETWHARPWHLSPVSHALGTHTTFLWSFYSHGEFLP